MPDASQRLNVTDHKDVKVVDFVDSKILDEANISEIGQHLSEMVVAKDRPKILLMSDSTTPVPEPWTFCG